MNITTIRQRIRMIEELEGENRVSKELLKSALENDAQYTEVARETKEALSKRRRIKDEIYSQSENEKVVEDIKANKEEIDTLQEILSAELADYYAREKTDEIEDAKGTKRKFKVIVKLLPTGKFEQ